MLGPGSLTFDGELANTNLYHSLRPRAFKPTSRGLLPTYVFFLRTGTVFKLCGGNCSYSDEQLPASEEEETRLRKRGLWQDANRMPPWEWRRRNETPGKSPTACGHFLTPTRSEADAGYDRIQDGADTARRRAHRIEDPEADVQ